MLKAWNLAEALAGKPVVTRDGANIPREAIIHHPTHPDPNARLLVEIGVGYRLYNDQTGKQLPGLMDCSSDLFMKPIHRKGYLNLFLSASGQIHCSTKPLDTLELAEAERKVSNSGQLKQFLGTTYVIYSE